jgi:hypothetical protein
MTNKADTKRRQQFAKRILFFNADGDRKAIRLGVATHFH